MVRFSIVVAAVWPSLGIGYKGGLPWKSLKPDMAYFKKLTSTPKADGVRNVVIMGRKTWESIPTKFRPLSNRINVVLSRNPDFKVEGEDVEVFQSFDTALMKLPMMYQDLGEIFVIGGSQIYQQAFEHEGLSDVYITKVYKNFECDCFLPIDKTAYLCQTISTGKYDDIQFEFCIMKLQEAGRM